MPYREANILRRARKFPQKARKFFLEPIDVLPFLVRAFIGKPGDSREIRKSIPPVNPFGFIGAPFHPLPFGGAVRKSDHEAKTGGGTGRSSTPDGPRFCQDCSIGVWLRLSENLD